MYGGHGLLLILILILTFANVEMGNTYKGLQRIIGLFLHVPTKNGLFMDKLYCVTNKRCLR